MTDMYQYTPPYYANDSQNLQNVFAASNIEQNCFTYDYDQQAMSTAGSYSPSSMESPYMDTHDSFSTVQVLDMIHNPLDSHSTINLCERTEIKIIVQPVDKFRFRYKSEMMGTHGSLLGERDEPIHKKEVPTVQLINCPVKNAVIRCTLVTADEDRRFPHAHHLIRKDGNSDKDDPHDIEVTEDTKFVASFCNMGIIHTAKKNIKEEILRKRRIELIEEKKRIDFNNYNITTREDLEMQMEAEKAQKWMNLNSVALCFQGFCYGENNVLHPLTEKIYSRPINNLKSALTGELKICRIDKCVSSCEGNEEVWLLVEKVGKKNIKIKFYEVDDCDNVIWDADGRFSELDVHHQYAIVFKTPPYKDITITKPVEVYLKLERPSDGEVSNCITFKYNPSNKILNRKRPRISSSACGSLEFTRNHEPNPQLKDCVYMSQTYVNLTEDISNISGELKKLLNDNTENNSEDLKKFINDSDLEKYLNLMESQSVIPLLDDGLTTDGGSSTEFKNNSEDFAKDILRKAIKILLETEMTNSSKLATITNVRNLLMESTNYGDTPLHFSLRHEQYEISKYLLTILSIDSSFTKVVNMQNSSGKTPLHLAVLLNKPEIVRALLKIGADPNLCDEEDSSSLHSAVIVDACDCLDELLNSNTKLNLEAHIESGWAPIHLAVKVGSLHAVKSLIAAGVDVNSTDMSYGRTALHIAVDNNHLHIVNYLLARTKIDVNKKNFGGNTALHGAVVKGGKCAEELIKILKKYGADPHIRNHNFGTQEEDTTIPPPVSSIISDFLQISNQPTIKSESSDSDDEDQKNGDSSLDLVRSDFKLMQLLNEKPKEPIEEELDLKEESEEDITFQDKNLMMEARVNLEINPELLTFKNNAKTSMTPPVKPLKLPPSQFPHQNDEKLTDEHLERINPILDRTGGWERLANHTNHGSLVRLYRKVTSPSTALFVKIRLQQPDITVRQVKKLLIEVKAFEAASALEKNYI